MPTTTSTDCLKSVNGTICTYILKEMPCAICRASSRPCGTETGQHVGGPAYFPDTQQLPDSIAEEIAIVDRTPRETPRSISHAYAASIQAAQKSIRIVNPYFVPTKSIRKAIKNALKKVLKWKS